MRSQRVIVRVDPLSIRTGGGSLSECTVLSNGSVMSKELVLNTGAPQGCILTTLRFSVYINCNTSVLKLVKYADDST